MNIAKTLIGLDNATMIQASCSSTVAAGNLVYASGDTVFRGKLPVALASSAAVSTCPGQLFAALNGGVMNGTIRPEITVSPIARLTKQNTSAYAAVGSFVYLSTAGGLSATPGTINRIVGRIEVVSATDGVIHIDTTANYGSNAEVAYTNGTTVTNVAVATPLWTKTFPANSLAKGRYRIQYAGITPSSNSTDTLTITVVFGGTTIFTSTAVDQVNNDVYIGEINLTVRDVPGASVAVVIHGYASDPDAPITTKAIATAGTFATNGALDFVVNATWSVAHASNQTRLIAMSVDYLD